MATAAGQSPPTTGSPSRRRTALLWLVPVVIFGIATAATYWGLLRGGFSSVAPIRTGDPGTAALRAWDQRFAIWGITRNARAFLSPFDGDFFAAGQCYPVARSLGLGHGVVLLGLLAVPLQLFSVDPVLAHNLVLVGLTALSPLAMYLLVVDWTGSRSAGVLAGLLYGFHPVKIGSPEHFYLTDTVWTVLAWFFLRRFFATDARWTSAIGLAAAASAQLAAGVYPAVAGFVVSVPLLAGAVVAYGASRRHVAPAVVGLLLVGVVTYTLLAPHVALRDTGALNVRGKIFLQLSALLPGKTYFVGWMLLLLLPFSVAFAAGRSPGLRAQRVLVRSLFVSALVGILLASGGALRVRLGDTPAAFAWLERAVPGLAIGRAPAYMYAGAHVALSVLVGAGAAWLVARVPRRGPLAGAALVAIALASVVARGAFGIVSVPRFDLVPQRPRPEALAFFAELERRGSSGPLLQLPRVTGIVWWARASESLLLTAYHRRPTSECFTSFSYSNLPEDVEAAIGKLPEAEALATLRRAGFTTVVVHPGWSSPELVERLTRGASTPGSRLSFLYASSYGTAFTVR